ncbi:MAG: CDP-alcohol phosphatidyltransferase family protein [Verrucomicrobiales bacterium]|jgi:cardiolipin synthase|nr:CDP-alcohol phosphatidyltransferase family protein [Verrucomicrobiales bacterium]MBP9224313.1 CDP-alcohol phosphatidyltransferase family protein [Verrucomicrobiales bacterium]HQZ27498.1 CDP-alcohol phosphatidyltransferase family protein [Verrucomicrobiales bacterium]
MTLANKITITRMLLIPGFIVFAAYYSESITAGKEDVSYRIIALLFFATAALSDAVDGYIARNYNQSTALGRVLDPVADKLLLLSGILMLSLTNWHSGLPIWFAVLVIARDVLITSGVLIIHFTTGTVRMRPIITSKICTALQLSCVCWVLIDFWSFHSRPWPLEGLIFLAAAFTLISGVQYVREGIHQLREAGHTSPDNDVT